MSAIDDKYSSLGGPSSPLGSPKGPEVTCANKDWTKRDYQFGSIYFWKYSSTGAHEIHGNIALKYYSLNSEASALGYPQSDETGLFDGFGRVNYFDNGMIFWRATVGTFEVQGAIAGRYRALGGPQGLLGYPLSDESPTSDNTGRCNQFQGGVIYYKWNTPSAHEVHGAILAKWKSLGLQTSSLGYPVTNEMPASGAQGARQSRFEHGTILWTPSGGAQVI